MKLLNNSYSYIGLIFWNVKCSSKYVMPWEKKVIIHKSKLLKHIMYTDETQILIMLFSKPKKKMKKYCITKKCFWGIWITKTWHRAKCSLLCNVLPEKKGKVGAKKGRKTQFSIRQLLRVDLIVEIDSWS